MHETNTGSPVDFPTAKVIPFAPPPSIKCSFCGRELHKKDKYLINDANGAVLCVYPCAVRCNEKMKD